MIITCTISLPSIGPCDPIIIFKRNLLSVSSTGSIDILLSLLGKVHILFKKWLSLYTVYRHLKIIMLLFDLEYIATWLSYISEWSEFTNLNYWAWIY